MKPKPGSITLVGTIVQTGPITKVGKKETSKLTIIIVDDEESDYPNYYPVDYFKNRIDWASNFAVGDEVRIRGVVNGRKFDSPEKGVMYFLGITGFSIKYADEPEKTNYDDEDEPDGAHSDKGADVKFEGRHRPKQEKASSKEDGQVDDGDDLPF